MSTFSANGSPTCTAGRLVSLTVLEALAGQDAGAADPVAPGARAEEHDLVADSAGVGQVQVLVAEHADRERVHQRVRLIHRVEPGLAADVRQAEAVAVEADAAHHAGQHAGGVGVVDRAEAERVHDGDGARAHRDDVAHDAADSGRRSLERLHVARVVVALDLERDGPALADIHHAGVLAHADHEVLGHLGADLLTELAQPHLARLVGAVLAPHHRVHRQLAARRAPAEDRPDPFVLVGLQPERGERLLFLGGGGGVADGVDGGRAHAGMAPRQMVAGCCNPIRAHYRWSAARASLPAWPRSRRSRPVPT